MAYVREFVCTPGFLKERARRRCVEIFRVCSGLFKCEICRCEIKEESSSHDGRVFVCTLKLQD